MRDFAITTDSNSDLPQKYIDKYQVTIIPQYYSFGMTVYGDELNMPPEEFYQKMSEGELPTSQANNPAVIEDKFTKILEQGKDIIHIAFSSALSGSYNNVCMVAQELEEKYPDAKITIIDSLNATLAETILVLEAYKCKDNGGSYEAVVDRVKSLIPYVNSFFVVDDLFHLLRGGRVNKTTAVVGSTLKLKPFMYIANDGTISANGTFRGRKKAFTGLIDKMLEHMDDNPDPALPICIAHGNCLVDAKAIAQKIMDTTPFKNIIINDISPSIGTHSGPGTVALFFIGKETMEPKKKD